VHTAAHCIIIVAAIVVSFAFVVAPAALRLATAVTRARIVSGVGCGDEEHRGDEAHDDSL
jgi:hypothetical protein